MAAAADESWQKAVDAFTDSLGNSFSTEGAGPEDNYGGENY
jgi:hypothetical protein